MVLGIPVGVDDRVRRDLYPLPSWGTAYVFGLTLLLVALALLSLGLVRPWGEVLPRWIPVVGGKDVPPLAAVVPAGAGAVAVTMLWVNAFANIKEICGFYGLEGAERTVMIAGYSPLLLWGPLLAGLTVSYARRRRASERVRSATGRRWWPRTAGDSRLRSLEGGQAANRPGR